MVTIHPVETVKAKSAEDGSDNPTFLLLDLPKLVLDEIIKQLSLYHL